MHQPTLRVLRILSGITEAKEGMRLADFSRELEIPKSTLVPILQTLCEERYLIQDKDGRYTAGTALFSLGAAFSGCFPLLDFVKEELRSLADMLGETCYFGVLQDGQVLYLEKADCDQPIRMLTARGRRLAAYATGIGKALLAGKSEEELRRMYPKGLQPLTERTITDFSVLAEQTFRIEQDGYAWEIEESTRYIRCFAVPVRKGGQVVAAISVAVPLFRYEEEKQGEMIGRLREAAEQIGSVMDRTDAHFADLF